ncbi:GntR family transcriptional regulator [Bacillus dakarensis]|uniref:GntR family transcriptional regulator n=1 Tax=Robertmurraya dakarensis TaxID=1926278 RepID=UPI0009817A45|nr:GntR family transcriptional regulator [Bacillus dakarensis]
MFTVSAKLPGENNRNYSYRVIKEAIMSLQLEPGQSISEIELAELLQISRTPIREVMAKLREEHLVEVIPQVGTYVSKINPLLIEEAAFVRVTLEREILKLSCESFPKDTLFDLKKNVAHQEVLIGQKGMEQEFHRLDKDFHCIIYRGNNKENAWSAITRLSTHYNRIRLLSEMEHNFEDAIFQHKKIIDIIEQQQTGEIEAVVQQHIIEPIQLWEDLYQPDSPYANYFDRDYKKSVFS